MRKLIKVELNRKFNLWTTIKELPSKRYTRYVECVCECGTVKKVSYESIVKGLSKSCGCYRSNVISALKKTHGEAHNRSLEYGIWCTMKNRCNNPSVKCYKNYGGRGIKVCDRWMDSFESFLSDVGRKPNKHTLERIDNSKGYSPENCRWDIQKNQMRNTRANHFIQHLGENKTVVEWSEIFQTKYKIFHQRLTSCDWDMNVLIFRFYQQFLYLKEVA